MGRGELGRQLLHCVGFRCLHDLRREERANDRGIRRILGAHRAEQGDCRELAALVDPNTQLRIDAVEKRLGDMELLEAQDVAAGIIYAVTQPQRVNVNILTLYPAQQAA